MAVSRYIVSYDICEPKRLRRVATTMQNYGRRLQYSVFECLLDDSMFETLKSDLSLILNHDNDQILFISLGSEERDTNLIIKSLGLPYTEKSIVSVI
jgi:CRISPR-associated protein Cas2